METTSPEKTRFLENAGQLSKTIAYYAAFIALGLTTASLGPTLPGLAENTHSPLNQISYLFTARALGYLIGSLHSGRVYDKRAGHPVMAMVLLLMAATLALVPVISLLWVLVFILFVMGLGEGGLDVGGNTLLVWVHRSKVGPYMNGLHFFFGFGAFLSPIIVAQAILIGGGITWAYWALALLMLPAAAALHRLPSPINTEVTKASQPVQTNRVLVALIAVFFFLYVAAEVSFGGWIFTYATSIGLDQIATAAFLTSAFWGALTVGRLLAVPLTARFRPRFILSADLLGCLISVAIILFGRASTAAIWVGTIGLGLSMASVFPTTISLAERRMTITGRITSWFFVGASAGGMTLPWLIGQLFEAFGPQMTMIAILTDLALASGVFAALMLYSSQPAKLVK